MKGLLQKKLELLELLEPRRSERGIWFQKWFQVPTRDLLITTL
jgi:hypothetical protein